MTDKIICDECKYREICKYREEYEQVHIAVTGTVIHRTLDNGRHSIRNVSDIPYITLHVECKYHTLSYTNSSVVNRSGT